MPNLVRTLRDKLRMMREDAQAIAHTVEHAFKGEDEVDDEALDKDLRQLFYDLQDEKILDVRRREFERDGQRLRGYYWHLREATEQFDLLDGTPESDPAQRLYGRLDEEAWERRRLPE